MLAEDSYPVAELWGLNDQTLQLGSEALTIARHVAPQQHDVDTLLRCTTESEAAQAFALAAFACVTPSPAVVCALCAHIYVRA
jgi:hypothetical protein